MVGVGVVGWGVFLHACVFFLHACIFFCVSEKGA